ncbi:MAG: hypothetical protein ACYDD0_07540 [Candidatus Dormibacteria bacterium]
MSSLLVPAQRSLVPVSGWCGGEGVPFYHLALLIRSGGGEMIASRARPLA